MERKELIDILEHFIASNEALLQIKTSPGYGKTTTTLRFFQGHYGSHYQRQFIYLSQIHKIIEDNIKNLDDIYGNSLLHLKSKVKCCKDTKLIEFAKQFPIDRFCKSCANKCDYRENVSIILNNPASWAGVHNHLGNYVEACVSGEFPPPLVIIDENYLSAMMCEFTFDQHFIEKVNIIDKRVKKSLGVKTGETILYTLKSLSKKKIEALLSTPLDSEYRAEYEKEAYKEFIATGKVPINFPAIWEKVNRLYMLNTGKECMTIDLDKNKKKMVRLNFVDRISHELQESIKAGKTKVLILDSTTPAEINERIFGIQPVIKTIHSNVPIVAYQIDSGKYGLNSLVAPDGSRLPAYSRLLSITNEILMAHSKEKVLVIARRDLVNNYLKPDLSWRKDNFELAHFWGLRGSNEFLHCDACVLFGGSYPNTLTYKTIAGQLGISESILLELNREQEMVQALHRIRPILKQKTAIYVLSKMDIGIPTIKMKGFNIIRTVKGIPRMKEETQIKKFIYSGEPK